MIEHADAVAVRRQAAIDLAAATDKEQAITALMESTVYGLAIIDHNGKIVAWNQAMAELSQWSPTEAIGRNLVEVIPDEMRQQHTNAFQRAMADPTAHQQTQVVRCAIQPRDPKSSAIPVQVTVRVVDAAKGPYAIAMVDRQGSILELDNGQN